MTYQERMKKEAVKELIEATLALLDATMKRNDPAVLQRACERAYAALEACRVAGVEND